MIARFLKHIFFGKWNIYTKFPSKSMNNIQSEIKRSEKLHRGEIRFAVEASINPMLVLKKVTARQRAIQIFSLLNIWDTEENTGVLIYLLLADHDIEIIADRGINKKVPQKEWDDICHEMEIQFKQKNFEQGVISGIQKITYLLAKNFPHNGNNDYNELPDSPVIV